VRRLRNGRDAVDSGVVDLIPFIFVADVQRSIAFYATLGFDVVKGYASNADSSSPH
jgi:hypothetical protein